MLYVAFLTVYEHYQLDEATISLAISNAAKADTNPSAQPANNSTLMSKANVVSMSSNTTNSSGGDTETTRSIQWFQPLAIVPVLCFAYQTHEVVVPVYACMQERVIGSFMKASIFGLIILFFLYNLVGAYGYLTFGANVGPDIMSLYDAKDPIVIVGIVALVIKFITTYPPLMFCGRSALDGLYGEVRKLSTEELKSSERTRRIVITTLWFLSTVTLAVFAPDISVTLQLLGSMASINVFVFPGMCLVSLTTRLRRARQTLLLGELPDNLNHQRNLCYYNQNQSLQHSSWDNNRSTNGRLLERLETSIAPSTVAQIGISSCVAIRLYLFSALLIAFGAFIFVLELVSVFGLHH